MRFFYSLVIFFFLFSNVTQSSESIRFININYIVNNSEVGKSLNKIRENKNKSIEKDIKSFTKKLEDQKNKIISQKNILKKEEFDKLAQNYENELKNFNAFRIQKKKDFDNFRVQSKKKFWTYWIQ